MKCDMVRDLLPSYAEQLTSAYSNDEIEKHLSSCMECRQYYQQMTEPIGSSLPILDAEEVEKLDYLKKVRKKNKQTLFLSIFAVLVLVMAVIGLFAIGLPVSSKDVKISYQNVNDRLEVHLTLENGKDLIFSNKSKFIYDEDHNVVGYETRYTPKGVFHNPFDDVGKEMMLGMQNHSSSDYKSIFILEFKDKTMTFVDGILVK
ncbi:zf-HC2 domain-containing protein [Paenibacillus dokdonensis]|uniref:zf-HC2 domain-containing protein n=1 Tax=Paenibacillus dokdonensis TaxID=2567944 RepID=UPI0010A8B22A|nr:zf-HC2 domain-containing protein [Paenibacillus dokdonensis]